MSKKTPLGEQIDAIKDQDDIIHRIERRLKKAKAKREKLEAKLLRDFKENAIKGAKGDRGVASVLKSSFPSIKDRRKFMKYVIKAKAWDLFQNRIASKAYFDRLEEGETVPGVSVFERTKVSVRSVS